MGNRPVRMDDIAAAAGVTTATVSMALRNNPRIAEKTRLRIKEIADQMHYKPDPVASALALRVSKNPSPQYLGTIAFLCEKKHYLRLERSSWHTRIKTFLEHVCAQMGYRLDSFPVEATPRADRALNRMLLARGIKGLLIMGDNIPVYSWNLDWDKFAVVGYSISQQSHMFHNVVSSSYQDAYDATLRLFDLGYTSPSLFDPNPGTSYWVGGFTAAYCHAQSKPLNKLPPMLIFKEKMEEAEERKRFIKWFNMHRPDVILGNYDHRMVDLMASLNISVPEQVGYCCLDNFRGHEEISGLIQPREEAFRLMVDILHGLLIRHEYGPPANPHCTQIPSKWNEGSTLLLKKPKH